MKLFDEIIEEVEILLEKENLERNEMGAPPVKKTIINILGQMSLLLNETTSTSLPLMATADIDAIIKGDTIVRQYLLNIIKPKGLRLDDLSSEIWIPEDATFHEYYESNLLKVNYIDPISALTSKAIKAKEKNRFLIKHALKYYGNSLSNKILFYGGDIKYFNDDEKLKL